MKKTTLFVAGLFFLLFSFSVNGQSKSAADYFSGKWDVLVKGTPGGDSRMFVSLDKKDSSVAGVILDTAGVEISKISKVELKENECTVYFTAQGYDVYLLMNKKDEDHITGNLMGMFDADGDRVKAVK